jgi:hypothetical protein
MAFTRAEFVAVLVSRLGPTLAAVGIDTAIDDPAAVPPVVNADLADAMAAAARSLPLTLASPVDVSDVDLANATQDQVAQLADVGTLRALESALGAWDQVDESVGLGSRKEDQLGQRIEKAIARWAEKCRRLYGVDLGTLSGGAIDLDFAQACDLPEI